MDSAGGESWTQKEAEEEAGKRSEMAEMRSVVPRYAEESITEAGKAEESVAVGSGKMAMNQDVIGLSYTQDEEEILQQMARTRKLLQKLPTNKGRLEEDSNRRKTEPATADRNSMAITQDVHLVDPKKSALAKETADDKSALAKKTADDEIKAYVSYRKNWESHCCGGDCDHFGQRTTLGSMQYAHCMPKMAQLSFAETLQVFSMKLKFTEENAGDFELPLSVYGMVAVRDILDSRRNILFSCDRTVAQELTQDDPFLLLTGPSRAIVSGDEVYFEIHLKVKGASASQDKPLITCVRRYSEGSNTALCFNNVMCTLEVCLRKVKGAVQATIMCVQIVTKNTLWPSNFAYGGRVTCTPLPRTTDIDGDQKIVLVESKGREFPQGCFGYVHLRSQVVSVEFDGELAVVIQPYNESGALGKESCIRFEAQNSQVREKHCFVGQARVCVTVAWSVVPTDMYDVVYGD